MGVPREYEYEYSEDRVGIVWGGEGVGKVRGKFEGVEVKMKWYFLKSSRMWAWKVRGKFEGGENSRVWLGMFEGAGIEGAWVSVGL